VLPASNRLRSSADFARTVRSGVRVGRPTLVVHALRHSGDATRVGFVVSKAVGGAVVRNRVKRRLRALARPLVMVGSAGRAASCDLVVRALPAANTEPGRLADDLAGAWQAAYDKALAVTAP